MTGKELSQVENFLIDSGLITRDDLKQARDNAGEDGDIGAALLARGLLSEDDLRRVDAYLLGVPYVDLKGRELELETLSLIPEPIARNYNLIAFKKSGRSLEVAVLDTEDLEKIEFLKEQFGFKILPRLTDQESLKSALVQYSQALKAEFGDIIKRDISELKLDGGAEDPTLGRLVDTILKHAVVGNATDIHIDPSEKDTVVRYRIKGKLHDAMVLPRETALPIALRLKFLSGLELAGSEEAQEGRFVMDLEPEKLVVRVSALPARFGDKIVMRLLKENVSGFSLEGLGFGGDDLEKVHRALEEMEGLILVAGPSGSGKTTTLYTMLDILNRPELDISTIEDPIEYELPRVNQSEIKPEAGFTFSSATRALLRQDPDVIMVGELRDAETANLIAAAAGAGKLVLTAVRAVSATDALAKLVDMGVEPQILAASFKMIVGQHLVRRLGPNREKYFLTPDELASLSTIASLDKVLAALQRENLIGSSDSWEQVAFSRSVSGVDYGLVGVQEILTTSSSVRELIAGGAPVKEIRERAKAEGMLTMVEDGILKAAHGLVALEDALGLWKETEN